jgi:hypothetical protein
MYTSMPRRSSRTSKKQASAAPAQNASEKATHSDAKRDNSVVVELTGGASMHDTQQEQIFEQYSSVKKACERSLAATHEMFLSNYGHPLEVNTERYAYICLCPCLCASPLSPPSPFSPSLFTLTLLSASLPPSLPPPSPTYK